jgi:hypothetical protein
MRCPEKDSRDNLLLGRRGVGEDSCFVTAGAWILCYSSLKTDPDRDTETPPNCLVCFGRHSDAEASLCCRSRSPLALLQDQRLSMTRSSFALFRSARLEETVDFSTDLRHEVFERTNPPIFLTLSNSNLNS